MFHGLAWLCVVALLGVWSLGARALNRTEDSTVRSGGTLSGADACARTPLSAR